MSPTLYQSDLNISNHRGHKFPPSLTLLSFKTRTWLNDLQYWPQLQVFREYVFNSCTIQGNVQAFQLTGLLWWRKLSLFSSIFFKICRFRNSIQSAFAVSFYSMRSDARVKFDSGVIFLDLSQFFATHSNQWDCFTYGGSFDTIRVLKSRPLPTLVNTGKATWQNLLSIQNEILNCKYDLIPLSFSPSGNKSSCAYAHFIRCAYCCNINVSDYTTAFVGKWTSC